MSRWEFNESFTPADFDPSNVFQSEWSELQSAPVPRGSAGSPAWVLPDLAIITESPSDGEEKRSDDSAVRNANVQPLTRKIADSRKTESLSLIVSPASGSSRDNLPKIAIAERDRCLERLGDAARKCSKSDIAVSRLVQGANGMVGFGAVLSALTAYANLHESA
ncbi:MAG: hypothetical protein K2X93_22620 [Candidatus Obscuribacterales bacterium]|nr:hypothetical protein [Candidatus Obscuribacterales bacterium]